MPGKEQIIDNIKNYIEELSLKRFPHVTRIQDTEGFDGIYYKKIPYNVRNEVVWDNEGFSLFEPDSLWGGSDQHYYFRFTFKVPEKYDGKPLLMFVSTGADDIWNTDNPQLMIYVNRELACAMDMNHDHVILSECAHAGDEYEIGIYAYSNTEASTNSLGIKLTSKDEDAIRIYYDLETPFEVLQNLPEDDQNQTILLETLERAISLKPEDISKYLLDNLYGKNIHKATVKSVGHTHIDVAWKWPLRQTREKVIRSWTNVLNLMDRYPEYKFMASTPQLYEYVSEDEPLLFDRIKDKVKEGRFEPEGCMWLEPDCNIPSGESLIRQIIYGQKYFKENFGHETQVLWIPDAFGYSKELPQILVKSGIKYFMTTKLSWNDTNRLPYDLMYYKGIDGSKVLLYVITTCDNKKALEAGNDKLLNYTYNGLLNPSQVMGTWTAFRHKDITENVLTCYGYGDGGGGPTEDMLEKSRRMNRGIPGCPRTEQTSVTDFFHKLEEDFLKSSNKPEYSEELYLEYHRGTYTSMGVNKRYNRLSEYMVQDVEFLCTMNLLCLKQEYPSASIDEIWKIILLNQFHDILPGSSIKDVYDDSQKQYEKILTDGQSIIDKAEKELADSFIASDKSLSIISKSPNDVLSSGKDYICINTAGHDRCGLARTDKGKYVRIKNTVPAKGIAKADIDYGNDTDSLPKYMSACKREDGSIVVSTLFYEAVFSKEAEITDLFDKVQGIVVGDKKGMPLGRLIAFEDKPKEYDCWNIDADYENVSEVINNVQKMEIYKDDPFVLTIHIERKFRNSFISQNVIFYNDIGRIDFETDIDWHEHQVLLKAAFNLNIKADSINAEIQFGNVSRSLETKTSFDKARFEMCAHRWVDMAGELLNEGIPFEQEKPKDDTRTINNNPENKPVYGVSILNDCKYGYDAKDNTIRLTLLKSGIYPNPCADNGHHHFTYSIYSHKGDYRQGKVIEEAENLNRKLILVPACDSNAFINSNEPENGFGIIDTGSEEGIFIDTVKKAEETDDIIVRLYEGYGYEHNIKVSVPDALLKAAGFKDVEISECDLRENVTDKKGINTLCIRPFEIVTLKLHFIKM